MDENNPCKFTQPTYTYKFYC